jgi:hypothetical protein
MTQLTLDIAAKRAEALQDLGIRRRPRRRKKIPIRVQFECYHASHREVYRLLVKLSRDVKASGRRNYGMRAVFERARWHYHIERAEEKFVLNNNYSAHYARLIDKCEHDLRGFFPTRRLRSD